MTDERQYPEIVYRLARAYGVSPHYVFRVGFEEIGPVRSWPAPDADEDDDAWELSAGTWTPPPEETAETRSDET